MSSKIMGSTLPQNGSKIERVTLYPISRSVDLHLERFYPARVGRRPIARARRNGNEAVHLGSHVDVVVLSHDGRLDYKPVSLHVDVHEHVEHVGHFVRAQSIRRDGFGEVCLAAPVGRDGDLVPDLVYLWAAPRAVPDKVNLRGVLHDGEHQVLPRWLGVELCDVLHVARALERVQDNALANMKVLPEIVGVENYNISDLATLHLAYAQDFSLVDVEGSRVSGGNDYLLPWRRILGHVLTDSEPKDHFGSLIWLMLPPIIPSKHTGDSEFTLASAIVLLFFIMTKRNKRGRRKARLSRMA